MKGQPLAPALAVLSALILIFAIAHYRQNQQSFWSFTENSQKILVSVKSGSTVDSTVPAVVPATVLPPTPGFPDFNGASAVMARHAKIQTSPTDLEEQKTETRGSFSVLMARAGSAEDGEVSLAIWGPPTPFKCTIRGYRKLSGDFEGNTVATGYKQVFAGTGKITTGLISPGVIGEYDVLSCRSSAGEVQYFRINYDS